MSKAFDESPDLGVFVGKRVSTDKAPILIVNHDRDGDWIFAAGDEEKDDAEEWMLLHLHHVVENHPDVLEVADLPIGFAAVRNSVRDPWVLEELEEGDDSDG